MSANVLSGWCTVDFDNGIIVSIQGYTLETTRELAKEAVAGGAVGIKTDKPVYIDKPVIGCNKISVERPEMMPYLTNTIERVQQVARWANIVSIDYRRCNQRNLFDISGWCEDNKILVVADIGCWDDYRYIKDNNLYFTWIATTFSVFRVKHSPDVRFARKLVQLGERVIAEGNFVGRKQIEEAIKYGIKNICIGGAISNVYKLTKRYTSVYCL